ncbi:hypothetical protein REPUB_Repub12eG0094500 [Reevesia pubescens]
MSIWIQLPELPIEYYDMSILYKIGSLISKPIKIDMYTGNANHAQYTRICVEVTTYRVLPQIGNKLPIC